MIPRERYRSCFQQGMDAPQPPHPPPPYSPILVPMLWCALLWLRSHVCSHTRSKSLCKQRSFAQTSPLCPPRLPGLMLSTQSHMPFCLQVNRISIPRAIIKQIMSMDIHSYLSNSQELKNYLHEHIYGLAVLISISVRRSKGDYLLCK